jgi:hypothetical protein
MGLPLSAGLIHNRQGLHSTLKLEGPASEKIVPVSGRHHSGADQAPAMMPDSDRVLLVGAADQ